MNSLNELSALEKDYNNCPECNNSKIISDFNKGEDICAECGVIIEDNLEYPGYDFNYKTYNIENTNKGIGTSLVQCDKGLSTEIPLVNFDASGSPLNTRQLTNARTLRHWDKVAKNNRSIDRNYRTAFPILLRIKDRLSLNETIMEKSAYYYRRIVDLKLTKGRSIEKFVGACVYLTCREFGLPRTLEEISIAIGVEKVDIGKHYRILVDKLNVQVSPVDSAFYLNKIANNVGISRRTLQKATEMMSEVKEHSLNEGKDPAALSTAVLYAACIDQGENKRQRKIAQAGEISVVTLRKRFLDIQKIFPFIPNNIKSVNLKQSNVGS